MSRQAGIRVLIRDRADAIVWGERAIAVGERQGDVETFVSAEAGRAHLERSPSLAQEARRDSLVAHEFINLGSSYAELSQPVPAVLCLP